MKKKIKKILVVFLTAALILSGVLILAFATQAYMGIFPTAISLSRSSNVDPQEHLSISYSFPVLAKGYVNRITVNPGGAVDMEWESNGKTLKIIPRGFWKPETRYTIFLPEGRNSMLNKVEKKELIFYTTPYPKVSGFAPENGAKDVVLDIEDPIVIDFDKSTRGFFVKFSINPESEVTYENNFEKTQFKIIPKNGAVEGKKYSAQVHVKYAKDTEENYTKIYESSFETKPPVPEVWEKDFSLRVAQAKRVTRPKISQGKYIDINRATQIMTIFEDGKLLDSFLISSGKRGMETPQGEFQIRNKFPRAWSKVYKLYMPFWMAIVPSGKYGIHELPEWPGGYKEGANHLGTPVSHGCVRLGVGPAETVYNWAEIGTPVVVY